MTYKQKWRCNIHNVEFELELLPKDHEDYQIPGACPYCLQKENSKLKDEIKEVKRQRDALLKAIQIKQEFLVEKLDEI
jgi:biotin synthase-like enzyme